MNARSWRRVSGGRRLGCLPFMGVVIVVAGAIFLGQGVFIHAKAALAQVLLDRAFERTLRDGEIHKAWSWADTWPVARIEIPRLGQSTLVLNGDSGEALAFGPGHVGGSAEAGEAGYAIFSAHRDTHFRFMKDLRRGDEVIVTRRDGERFHFLVNDAWVAPWDNSGLTVGGYGPPALALTTCWPLNGMTRGDLRYVVAAELASPEIQSASSE